MAVIVNPATNKRMRTTTPVRLGFPCDGCTAIHASDDGLAAERARHGRICFVCQGGVDDGYA
jgi:hypothetical protein